jgi:hypothetical protein
MTSEAGREENMEPQKPREETSLLCSSQVPLIVHPGLPVCFMLQEHLLRIKDTCKLEKLG